VFKEEASGCNLQDIDHVDMSAGERLVNAGGLEDIQPLIDWGDGKGDVAFRL